MDPKLLNSGSDTDLFLTTGTTASLDSKINGRFSAMSHSIYRTLGRRKPMGVEGSSRLSKCLTALDLTALGVGSTLGVGVYVLAGSVAKNHAGPAVIISFLIAAIASIFAGLCYAEFGARVPKAGSAYVYSYVCVGEFFAFIIGWNLILEYVIGAASVVKGLSNYVDAMVNNSISGHLRSTMPMNVPHLSDYPDIFAFTIIILFSIAVAFGAKESSMFNNVFTLINLVVVLSMIIAGSVKADISNWMIDPSSVPDKDIGSGGFAPYGIAGIVRGAAVCFYGFIGFDCVATAGEEARQPQKSIPIAVVASLFIVFLAYFGLSTVLTMMWPYYLQDENAPFPYVFDQFGWSIAKYAVSVGAACGLCASLLGALFPLPRIIYSMANDGLLFSFMGEINERFRTPLVGTLVAGLFTGVLAAIFNLTQLMDMMSIGTLLAYCMVAACVLLLRYEKRQSTRITHVPSSGKWNSRDIILQLVNRRGHETPTRLSSNLVTFLVTFYVFCCTMFTWILESGGSRIACIVPALFGFASLVCISKQPKSTQELPFYVPFVPWFPGISILINVYLMINLDEMTWLRFTVWMVFGLIIYFSYGIWNSRERRRLPSQRALLQHQLG